MPATADSHPARVFRRMQQLKWQFYWKNLVLFPLGRRQNYRTIDRVCNSCSTTRCLLWSNVAAVPVHYLATSGPCSWLATGVFQGVQRRAVPLTLRRVWIRACYISKRHIILDRITSFMHLLPTCCSLCVELSPQKQFWNSKTVTVLAERLIVF